MSCIIRRPASAAKKSNQPGVVAADTFAQVGSADLAVHRTKDIAMVTRVKARDWRKRPTTSGCTEPKFDFTRFVRPGILSHRAGQQGEDAFLVFEEPKVSYGSGHWSSGGRCGFLYSTTKTIFILGACGRYLRSTKSLTFWVRASETGSGESGSFTLEAGAMLNPD